jgi:hypothetical protein
MAAKGTTDQFSNFAIISCLETAAHTLTFKKLETGISLSEKVAWVISRIEYVVEEVNATVFAATGQAVNFGLAVSAAFAVPTVGETTIIDYNRILRQDIGAAASGFFDHQPYIKDFASLPGGGILVPPTPLYLWVAGGATVAAIKVTARLQYTLLALATEQYWELVEARRVLSS